MKFSIVVPVNNGGEFIDSFFSYFEKKQISNLIEIIIVDNNSSEFFLEELQNKVLSFDYITLYSYNALKSSYAARNFGVEKSKGKIIAFTDFDCVLTDAYFTELLKINDSQVNLLSGKIKLFHVINNVFEIFDEYAYLKQEEYFDSNYAATANLVVSKDSFYQIGGFREMISGGDNEFCKRAVSRGYTIKYNSKMEVKHPLRGSFIEHIKKTKRLGKGHAQIFQLKNANYFMTMVFLLKNFIGVFFPIHQLKIFYKIKKNENISFKETLILFKLCFSVGAIQRIQILKKTL